MIGFRVDRSIDYEVLSDFICVEKIIVVFIFGHLTLKIPRVAISQIDIAMIRTDF